MKRLLFILSLMVCALNMSAQTYLEHLQKNEAGKGTVTVHQSHELDLLINGNASVNANPNKNSNANSNQNANHKANAGVSHEESSNASENTVVDTSKKVMRGAYKTTGYRVQVYAGGNSRTDKQKAERIGNEIKASFPGQPVYVHFYSPRWICRMGNFRSYEEAQAMLARVKAAGYKQASLVKGQITVTNWE